MQRLQLTGAASVVAAAAGAASVVAAAAGAAAVGHSAAGGPSGAVVAPIA